MKNLALIALGFGCLIAAVLPYVLFPEARSFDSSFHLLTLSLAFAGLVSVLAGGVRIGTGDRCSDSD